MTTPQQQAYLQIFNEGLTSGINTERKRLREALTKLLGSKGFSADDIVELLENIQINLDLEPYEPPL